RPFHFILFCILFNTMYALYGMPCSRDYHCKGSNEECIAGRCGCQSHTRVHWGFDLKVECDDWNVDKCKNDRDCGTFMSIRICNKNGICECPPGFIWISLQCYKTDKPNATSFLKDCDHDPKDMFDDDIIKLICHPEDNVFCSAGKCICYPGFYGDPETKRCRPKSEYIQDKNLSQYKVKPGMFCHSGADCIEGLKCNENFCRCPGGCVYKSSIESCDCGDYYDSDEYWDQSYLWPSIVGTFLGLIITCGWCWPILDNIDKISGGGYQENNEDEQALNTLPKEVNQTVSVPVVLSETSDVQNTGSPQPQASVPPYRIGT
ncbi:unnamed protein product, partial [Meganyctiphanes norvegica]